MSNTLYQVKTEGNRSIEMTLTLLSNWGHPDRLGLTEVQLFDNRGQKIEVDPSLVTSHGARHQRGTLGSLFSGKAKVISF